MSTFAELLKKKVGDTPLTTAAADAGVSVPSLRCALKGKSVPNARSIPKFAAYIGMSATELTTQLAATRGGDAPKAKGKPGPKPGRKGKPGPKPGPKGKPGRKPGRKAGGDVGAAFSVVAEAIASAEALAADALAMRMHNLGKKQRDLISSLLSSFG